MDFRVLVATAKSSKYHMSRWKFYQEVDGTFTICHETNGTKYYRKSVKDLLDSLKWWGSKGYTITRWASEEELTSRANA